MEARKYTLVNKEGYSPIRQLPFSPFPFCDIDIFAVFIRRRGSYYFANVCLSVNQIGSAHYLENCSSQTLIFHMPIGLGEDMTPIDFVFTKSKVKVSMDTFEKNVKMVSAHYLEYYL